MLITLVQCLVQGGYSNKYPDCPLLGCLGTRQFLGGSAGRGSPETNGRDILQSIEDSWGRERR